MIPKLLFCFGITVIGILLYRYCRSTPSTRSEDGEHSVSAVSSEAGTNQVSYEILPESSIAKISVSQTGKVILNGKPASLSQLDSELNRLKKTGGLVWYHRESSGGRASDAAMVVFARIGNARLPIKLFADAKFRHPAP